MKIAIDLDGTAWFHRAFFVSFVHAMQAYEGHCVGILTSHGEHLKNQDLDLWNAHGFSPPDFYISKSQEAKDRLKGTKGNNGVWKAEQVTEHQIDYLIGDLDGNEDYVRAFRKVHPYKLIRVWGEL